MKKAVILLLLFMFIFVERAYAGAQKSAVPAIQSPPNNAVLKIQNVTITWKDPYLQKPHYLWLIEESGNKVILKKIEIKKGIQKYTVPSNLLKTGYKYRYKVGVLGSKGNIYYSPIKYFQMTEYPEITYPVDNYTFARTEAVMRWKTTDPENSYVLRLVDDESGEVILDNISADESEGIILDNISAKSPGEYKIPPAKLAYGKKYRFVVGFRNTDFISWSKVVRFAVRDRINPPVYISDMFNKSEFQGSDIDFGQEGTGAFSLCHISYKNSIMMKPHVALTIPLNKKYVTFSSVIGLDDSVYLKGGSVVFRVTGDGRVLYESTVIRNNPESYFHSMPKEVDIDVTDIEDLTLEVDDAEDGIDFDNGVWAEPYLLDAKKDKQYPVTTYQKGDDENARLMVCNYPEIILDKHMNNQPILVLMRRDGVAGRNSINAEHMNDTTTQKPLYFGVFLHNKGQQDAYVKIAKKGVSSSPTVSSKFMVDAQKAFDKTIPTEISLKAGEYYWLFKGEYLKMNAPGQGPVDVLNALAEYESDQVLEVTVCVVEDLAIFDNPATIDETPEIPYDGVARVYRGTADMNPVTNLNLDVSIDETDTDNSPLNVSYPVFSAQTDSWSTENGSFPGWVTNITSDKIDAAIVSDMFTLNEQYNNTEITFSPTNRHSNNGFLCNLGNWGIVYKEAIHIKNNTDKNRIVRYYLGTVVSNKDRYFEAIALAPSGEPIKDLDPNELVYKQELLKLVREIEVPAFTEKELTFEYTLPNNSSGGLYHTLIQSLQ